jgi:hypothetical protein
MPKPDAPLFRRVLGAAFETLPIEVRRLHLAGSQSFVGEVEARRGTHLLARLCAWVTHLPPAFRGPIRVDITTQGGGEVWTRHVAGHAMRSRMWTRRGLLCERLGPLVFGFKLHCSADGLRWTVARVRLLGLPLPSRGFHGVHARESARAGRYHFDVSASLPLIGLLVHYHGWVDVP